MSKSFVPEVKVDEGPGGEARRLTGPERGARLHAALPEVAGRLIEPKNLIALPAPDELREMAKFSELGNIHGLAAHRIEAPAPPGWLKGFERAAASGGAGEGAPAPVLGGGTMACAGLPPWILDSESALAGALRGHLSRHTVLCARGRLGGEALPAWLAPVEVTVLLPQTAAHLAAGLQRMLWPAGDDEKEAAAPVDGGFDDCKLSICLVWVEAAVRLRSGEIVTHELICHGALEAEPPASGAGCGVEPQTPAAPPDGGEEADGGVANSQLGVIIGHDDPRLAAMLIERMALSLWGAPLAGQKPLRGLWANALRPVSAFADKPEAALELGSLLFGAAVDDGGRIAGLDAPGEPAGAIVPGGTR